MPREPPEPRERHPGADPLQVPAAVQGRAAAGAAPAPEKKPRGRPPKSPKSPKAPSKVEDEDDEEAEPERQEGEKYEYNDKMWFCCLENDTLVAIADRLGLCVEKLIAANKEHYGKGLKIKSKLMAKTAIEISDCEPERQGSAAGSEVV